MDHAYVEEHDVVESYLRDRLSDREREAFEAHYFGCETCLAQLELASDFREGMLQVGAEDTARTVAAHALLGLLAGLALLSRGQRLALAGLFLLLLVLPAGLLVRTRGLERQLTEARNARPPAPAPAPDPTTTLARFEAELRALREIADGDRRRLAELKGELEQARQAATDRPRVPQAPQVNVPIFMLAAVRGGEEGREPVNRVPLSAATGSVVLALELATVDYPSYRATLRAENGKELWQAGELRPDSRDTLVLLLPASMVPPGVYQLTIEGTKAEGQATAVGAYPFRTVRQP
jgi:hypothetical protein